MTKEILGDSTVRVNESKLYYQWYYCRKDGCEGLKPSRRALCQLCRIDKTSDSKVCHRIAQSWALTLSTVLMSLFHGADASA